MGLAVDLPEIDLVDPDNFVDGVPHDWFRRLRHEAPVVWHDEPDGRGFWAVSRHADVVAVSRDNQTFSSWEGSVVLNDLSGDVLEQQRLMMINMDPPRQSRYRRLVLKGFTPRMIEQLEARARQRAARIVDAACENGTCDFVTDIAAELPLQVIAEMMGIPESDRHLVFEWSNRMVGSQDPEYAATPAHAASAAAELYGYVNELAAAKRHKPGDDILSILLEAEVDGERLTDMEIDMFFLLLSVAGSETTRNLISHGMLALMGHPDDRVALRRDPAQLPQAIEEMLRWASPVMQFRRTATRDTEIGGTSIEAGDKVVIWYISANRDESVFTDPSRFDIHRVPNDHVAFGGGGPHFCMGAHLARMEANVMFGELLRRLPDMEVAGPVQRLRSNFINGIKHLPVSFTPSPPAPTSRPTSR